MVKECPSCHDAYTDNAFAPFCSNRCEEVFHEYAPPSLITQVYEQYKEEQLERN